MQKTGRFIQEIDGHWFGELEDGSPNVPVPKERPVAWWGLG